MKNGKILSAALSLMLIFSIMATVSAVYVPPEPGTWVYVEDYEFFSAWDEDLTGTHFNVTVGIHDVTDWGCFEIKLGYNTTLLDAVYIHPTPVIIPTPESPYTDWIPVDGAGIYHPDGPPAIDEEAGVIWVGALIPVPLGEGWNGSFPIVEIEFVIALSPPVEMLPEPENKTVGCVLDLYVTKIGDSYGDPILHSADDGSYTYIREQKLVGAPIAVPKVEPSFQYVGEYVTFDGTQSDDGGAPPLTYEWDVNSNGTIDATGATVSWLCEEAGIFNVTLTVTNAIPLSHSAIAYWEVGMMVGGILDLFSEAEREYPKGTITEFIGELPGEPCDSYAPGEEVTVFAEVTYNGAPANNVFVSFEAIDPLGYSWTYRTDETNDTGIATVSFRIPVPDEMPWLFGHWNVNATCIVGDVKLSDYMQFSVGWILEITGVSTTYAGEPEITFYQGDELMDATITLKNIALITKPVHLVVTVYDELGVPIFRQIAYQSAIEAGAFCSPTTTYHYLYFMKIPMWAFVGKGKVYANAYTDLPKNFGVPYCPEKSADITIKIYPRT